MAAPAPAPIPGGSSRLSPAILVLNWNADELRLCETISQSSANAARTGLKGLLRSSCIAPTFLNYLRDNILVNQPQLVVVTTPNEADSASYLHSDTLPNFFPTLQYQLLRREKIAGVGRQVTAVVTGATEPALRISVYAHNAVANDWTYADKNMFKSIPNGLTESVLQYGNGYAGMITLHLWHRFYGKFALTVVDLPEDALPVPIYTYSKNRLASKAVSNLSLLTWLTEITDAMSPAIRPDHLILCGTFNYQLIVPDKTMLDTLRTVSGNLTKANLKNAQQFDEGTIALRKGEVLEGFSEGVGGQGPLFMPTWRLTKGRGTDCNPDYHSTPNPNKPSNAPVAASSSSVSPSCFGLVDTYGSVGWSDRVYFKDLFTSTYMLTCEQYDRLDDPSMTQSSHAGVVAILKISSYS